MEIDKIIIDYVNAKDTDYAIMIDGEWGSGKSWYWNNVLTGIVTDIDCPDSTAEAPKKYKTATISLFGIGSSAELRARIFEETTPLFRNKYVKTGAKLAGLVVNKVGNFFNIGDVNKEDIDNVFSDISINLDDYVLCFDDLERVNEDVLIELLGYINNLIETDHVKVVFIANDKEIKSDDYKRYKEKLIRFTNTIHPKINDLVKAFANEMVGAYREYLEKQSYYIDAIYNNVECRNLRTLKFNLDVFERIFDYVRTTVAFVNKDLIENYMLLLSMMYCIEYRKDNDKVKLKSLLKIDRSWAYEIDTIEQLNKYIDSGEDEHEESPELAYLKQVKKGYFCNTFVWGCSSALVDYLVTGYCDENKIREDIRNIESELIKDQGNEIQLIYKKITDFWNTDDNELRCFVLKAFSLVNKRALIITDYPIFFLAIQRLVKFEFISIDIPIEKIFDLFAEAIKTCSFDTYINDVDGIYSSFQNAKTDEFESLIKMVKERNFKLYIDNNKQEFLEIIKDQNSIKPMINYKGVCANLFEAISPNEFIDLFLNAKNCRKGEFLQFFTVRYEFKECFMADKDFVAGLIPLLNEQIQKLPKSATFVYCKKLHELFCMKSSLYQNQN